MEKLDKKKVLAVVLIIALIAAFAGAVTLLYNSIDLLTNTTFYKSKLIWGEYKYVVYEAFIDGQWPLAIITLVAAIVAFVGAAAGLTSFIAKNPKLKIASIIVCGIAVVAFLALIIAASCVWTGFYKENAGESVKNASPHYIATSTTVTQFYALYSGVMGALIPQLVYFAIIAAVLLTVYIIDIKSAKTNAVETSDINSVNQGDNNND